MDEYGILVFMLIIGGYAVISVLQKSDKPKNNLQPPAIYQGQPGTRQESTPTGAVEVIQGPIQGQSQPQVIYVVMPYPNAMTNPSNVPVMPFMTGHGHAVIPMTTGTYPMTQNHVNGHAVMPQIMGPGVSFPVRQ